MAGPGSAPANADTLISASRAASSAGRSPARSATSARLRRRVPTTWRRSRVEGTMVPTSTSCMRAGVNDVAGRRNPLQPSSDVVRRGDRRGRRVPVHEQPHGGLLALVADGALVAHLEAVADEVARLAEARA